MGRVCSLDSPIFVVTWIYYPLHKLVHDALGNSGTGKTHIALGLGLAACQKGLSVGFTTAAALVHELMVRIPTQSGH